jgi:hypothetical protein
MCARFFFALSILAIVTFLVPAFVQAQVQFESKGLSQDSLVFDLPHALDRSNRKTT